MAHPLHHAESSAGKFGGVPSDYQSIHDWFDASKEHLALFTHRAMRHHAQGLFEAERVFGLTLTNSAGRDIPVRWIGELDLSRFRAAPSARLSRFSFECDGAFPAQC
ncbi:hypothetical protein GGR94_003665 [Sulfitobacter geojensis]|nr:hypothetical protein [Sulfitobacter geojensis]